MNTTITVRNIDPADKLWFKDEARLFGISMEEFVRRLIREKREKSERHTKPSKIFGRYFGLEYDIDLPLNEHFSYQLVLFSEKNEK